MISEKCVKTFCNGDITKIENYDKAIADKNQMWECHHRLEVSPTGKYVSKRRLIELGLYYDMSPEYFIFLTKSEYIRLHSKSIGYSNLDWTGKHHSETTKQKIRNKKLGKEPWNKGKKVGFCWNKNKKLSDEHKLHLKERHKGTKDLHWKLIEGKRVYYK